MYLIVIAWMYVVLMMSVAEATSSTGTLLGALVTFVLYGLGPVALVVYLMSAPARNKAIKKQATEETAQQAARMEAAIEPGVSEKDNTPPPSFKPDAGRHASGGAESIATADGSIAPVGKKL